MFVESAENIIRQVLNMHWSDYLDIIIVAYLIYRGMNMIRSTSAMRIAKVIGVLLVVTWLVKTMELYTMTFILDQVVQVGLIALVILFQPELRRMLDQLGNMNLKSLLGAKENVNYMDGVISQTVQACEVMSREKIGALIVFSRQQALDEYFKTGTVIDGRASSS